MTLNPTHDEWLALLKADDIDSRIRAIKGLEAWGDASTVVALGEVMLHDFNMYVREHAALALIKIGAVEAHTALIEALQDPVLHLGGIIGMGLSDHVDSILISKLVDVVRREPPYKTGYIAVALSRVGKPAVNDLISALTAPKTESSQRRGIINILGRIHDYTRTIPVLVACLQDVEYGDGVRVCDEAADALKRMNVPEAQRALDDWSGTPIGKFWWGSEVSTEALLADLQSPHLLTRRYAASRLCAMHSLVDTEVFVAMLDDEDPDIRESAMSGLVHGPLDERLIPLFVNAISDPNPRVRTLAIDGGLRRFNTPDVHAALIIALQDDHWGNVLYALWAIGEHRPQVAFDAVLHLLQHSTKPEDIYVCAVTLAKLLDPRSIPVLVNLLESEHTAVSIAGCVGLEFMAELARPFALQALTDSRSAYQMAGLLIAKSTKFAEVVPLVVPFLTSAVNYGRPMGHVAAEALYAIGTPEALAALEEWRETELGKTWQPPR